MRTKDIFVAIGFVAFVIALLLFAIYSFLSYSSDPTLEAVSEADTTSVAEEPMADEGDAVAEEGDAMAAEGEAMAAETPAADEMVKESAEPGETQAATPGPETGEDADRSFAIALQSVSEKGGWLTHGDQGTLTIEALDVILATCQSIGDLPRVCAPKIASRTGPFAVVSEAAASEASLLLRQCEEWEGLQVCRTDIEDERHIRDQDIGEAEPNTLEMRQYEKTRWSVAIHRTDLSVTPGEQRVYEDNASREVDKAPLLVEKAIAFTPQTCFRLEYDNTLFLVDKPLDCPEYQRGKTPYVANWVVEPLKSGKSQLWVKAIHKRAGRDLRSETVPTSPFTIEVEHWLTKVVDEFDLWTKLAVAISALMAAIAGWGIWKWFRKPKASLPPVG